MAYIYFKKTFGRRASKIKPKRNKLTTEGIHEQVYTPTASYLK